MDARKKESNILKDNGDFPELWKPWIQHVKNNITFWEELTKTDQHIL